MDFNDLKTASVSRNVQLLQAAIERLHGRLHDDLKKPSVNRDRQLVQALCTCVRTQSSLLKEVPLPLSSTLLQIISAAPDGRISQQELLRLSPENFDVSYDAILELTETGVVKVHGERVADRVLEIQTI
jgi:hypothetical protein